MNEQKNVVVSDQEVNIDLYSIAKDIWKSAIVILLLAASVSLFTYVYVGCNYEKQYESTSTFIVSLKGTNNNVHNNLNTTAQMAVQFSEILNSSVLQKRVAQELDLDDFPGIASANVITETNLLELTVQADSPELAFRLNKAIMDNYSIVTSKSMSNIVLDVLESPSIPDEPGNEFHPFSLMKKAFFYTLIILCGLTAVFSFLKDTVRKPQEVSKKLDGKLLETLYHEKKYKTWKARLHRKKSSILLTNPGTSFRYVENMKKLARKVSSQMKDQHAKTLMVTSFEEGEGKSTVAANLALALAEENGKVLLIDADFRKPVQFKIFGIDQEEIPSFNKVLKKTKSTETLAIHVPNSNLSLILNTQNYPNSTEMLATAAFRQLLDDFKNCMDYIIIDTPPISQAADAEELVDIVDASILVVRQHTALVKDLNDAIAVLKSAEGVMLGCVYNDVFHGFGETAKAHGYGYYGYGYGYGYGGKYGYGYGYGKRGQDNKRKDHLN